MALAGATGSVLSGVVVDATSYATLSVASGLLSLALLPALRWTTAAPPAPATPAPR